MVFPEPSAVVLPGRGMQCALRLGVPDLRSLGRISKSLNYPKLYLTYSGLGLRV